MRSTHDQHSIFDPMIDASRALAEAELLASSGLLFLQAQIALGNGGFPVLINALKNERGDLELVRGVLECLAIAVQPRERESQRQV